MTQSNLNDAPYLQSTAFVFPRSQTAKHFLQAKRYHSSSCFGNMEGTRAPLYVFRTPLPHPDVLELQPTFTGPRVIRLALFQVPIHFLSYILVRQQPLHRIEPLLQSCSKFNGLLQRPSYVQYLRKGEHRSLRGVIY